MAGSRGAEEQADPLRGIKVVEFTHMGSPNSYAQVECEDPWDEDDKLD